jgi:iron complex outermembrane receptor protein
MVAQGFTQSNKNGDAPDHVLPDYTQTSASAAGLWQYLFGEKTFYQIGVRYDYKVIDAPEQYKSNTPGEILEPFHESYNNVSFSTGFTWKLRDILLLRGNVASAYRTPSIAELLQDGVHGNRYEIGSRDFTLQRNIEGDLGIHYHSGQLAFDVSGYYNRIFDYIFLAPTADTTNAGLDIYRYMQQNATLYGLEITAGYIPFKWLKLNGSYSHIHSRFDDGAPLPFIPQDKLNFNITAPFETKGVVKNVSVELNPVYVFAQNRPYILETETDQYFLLNAFLRFKLEIAKQPLELSIFANNILNETYFDHLSTLKGLGFQNMGRNFNFRLTVPIN